jgi:myb proto-oncogene protein
LKRKCSSISSEDGEDFLDQQPLKRSVSAGAAISGSGFYFDLDGPSSPPGPSGSDASDTSVAGFQLKPDPPTSLSLSLPGAETETDNRIMTPPISKNPIQNPVQEKVFVPFSAEFLGVMQEMIKTEVRNYMNLAASATEQPPLPQRQIMCMQEDGFRNNLIKRIGINRVE